MNERTVTMTFDVGHYHDNCPSHMTKCGTINQQGQAYQDFHSRTAVYGAQMSKLCARHLSTFTSAEALNGRFRQGQFSQGPH